MVTYIHPHIVQVSPETCWRLLQRLNTHPDKLWPRPLRSPIHPERSLGITPQELEAQLFDPSLR